MSNRLLSWLSSVETFGQRSEHLVAVDAQGAQAQRLQLDEAAGVRLVVQPLVVLERRNDLERTAVWGV